MKIIFKIVLIYVFVNCIHCQYLRQSKSVSERRPSGGHNIYTNYVPKHSYPVQSTYFYQQKPSVEHWDSSASDRQHFNEESDGEYSPVSDKSDESIQSDNDYKEDNEDRHEIKHKEAVGKKFGKLDKSSDSGHKESELAKIGGHYDTHLAGRKDLEHKDYKADAEYSHDRGHGFIKAWSWDRVKSKKGAAGQHTKKLAEYSAGDKGAHLAIAKKESEGHNQKDIKAVKGEAGYVKAGTEESNQKSLSTGKSDYDKEFPIFG